MTTPLFSDDGAAALAGALASNQAYREAAATWEGSLLLAIDAPGVAGLYLDLWHGECRSARVANTSDRESADYILAAPSDVWRQLLTGALDPLTAVFGHHLRLERGRLLSLTPYLEAVRQLVESAAQASAALPQDNALLAEPPKRQLLTEPSQSAGASSHRDLDEPPSGD